jgi:hypothetical protein
MPQAALSALRNRESSGELYDDVPRLGRHRCRGLENLDADGTEEVIRHMKSWIVRRMTSKMIDPYLGYLPMWILRHRFVQELSKLIAEALVGEVYEDIALRVSNIEGAHSAIMRLSMSWRQEGVCDSAL